MAAGSALGAIHINGSEQKHHAICNAFRGSKSVAARRSVQEKMWLVMPFCLAHLHELWRSSPSLNKGLCRICFLQKLSKLARN